MDGGVDPTTSLREEDTPRLRCDGASEGVCTELGLERGEMLHQQGSQETIFTKGEQILLVQGVDIGFSVFFDDTVGDDDWATLVGCTNPVHGETSRKTGDGAEETLESLGQVVGDVVLVNLDRGPP